MSIESSQQPETRQSTCLTQRLRQDAGRIDIQADDQFTQRVSQRLHARAQQPPARPRARLAWWLAAPAVLVLALLVSRQVLTPETGTILPDQRLAVANLDNNLDQALASREATLRNELSRLQSDLQRVESTLGLGGKAFSK